MSQYQVDSIYHILDLAGSMGLPLEDMHFIIGRNTDTPQCFGIYEDTATGEFVVYKNKTDGTHVEHYRGMDEAYAAQQIWDKLESEIAKRRSAYGGAIAKGAPVHRDVYLGRKMEQVQRQPRPPKNRTPRRRRKRFNYTILIYTVVILSCLAIAIADKKQKSHLRNGYYTHRGDVYYQQSGNWYYYDDAIDDWEPYYDANDWYDDTYDYDDDYYGSYYTFDNEDSAFYSSEFYVDDSRSYDYGSSYDYDDDYDYDYDYDYDNDYDYDWDSDWDSWDSWDTDWDSDW